MNKALSKLHESCFVIQKQYWFVAGRLVRPCGAVVIEMTFYVWVKNINYGITSVIAFF